jgi:hypothetical protein
VSYSRCKRRWGVCRLGMRSVGTWGSPQQPLMASAGWLGPWNGRRARMPYGAPFIEALCPLCNTREERGEGTECAHACRTATGSRHGRAGAWARARSDTQWAQTPKVLGTCASSGRAGPRGTRRLREGASRPRHQGRCHAGAARAGAQSARRRVSVSVQFSIP